MKNTVRSLSILLAALFLLMTGAGCKKESATDSTSSAPFVSGRVKIDKEALKIKVKQEEYVPVSEFTSTSETRSFAYTSHDGLELREARSIAAASDVPGQEFRRFSKDNGKTWGEWENYSEQIYTYFGKDEMFSFAYMDRLWNETNKHYVKCETHRLGIGGAIEASNRTWSGGDWEPEHSYITITDEKGNEKKQMIRYQDGPAYVEGGKEMEYADANDCSITYYTVMDNGDLLIPLSLHTRKCCELSGEDYKLYCPEINGNQPGCVVARGVYNKKTGLYDFTFSNPIMINTAYSSRGLCEPNVAVLKSGRILLVFRGSNGYFESWGSRIDKSMPPVKWYSYSEDGGKTFTQPMPWHFDDREIFYSSSSMSTLVRSEKNGALYWIGNITDKDAESNNPRFPLYICQVDDMYGVLKKETLTEIDTCHDGESCDLWLSNWNIIQDRETGDIMITLTKENLYNNVIDPPKQKTKNGLETVCGGVWRYTVTVPEDVSLIE